MLRFLYTKQLLIRHFVFVLSLDWERPREAPACLVGTFFGLADLAEADLGGKAPCHSAPLKLWVLWRNLSGVGHSSQSELLTQAVCAQCRTGNT